MHSEYMPMNAAALMDRVFDLYKATFKTQIAFSLVIGIISFGLMIAVSIILALALAVVIEMTGGLADGYIVTAVVIVLVGLLPLYIGWLYLSASGHILISKQAFYGEPIEMPLRDALSALLRVISAAAAHILMSAPWLAILAFLIYSAASGYEDILFFLMRPAVLILGGLAYGLIYVIYSNIFALSIPVAIFERRIFFATVIRSYELLKGDFWKVLGLRILWTILVFLFSYSAQGLIAAIVGVLAAMAGNMINFGYIWLATGPLQFYVSLFVAILMGPMEGIMTALIYFNQKIKKDGLDIEIVLSRMS